MAPASLVTTCQRAIIRNVDNLQDLGDISYTLARPILFQLSSTDQLRSLELASPQILANDAECWRAFIARDFIKMRGKDIQPPAGYTWSHELHCKLKDDAEKEYQQQEDDLRRALNKIEEKKEANKSHIIHKVIQEDVRRLPKYADGRANPLAHHSNDRSEAIRSLKNAKGGTQIIRALRQQSRQSASAKKLNQPFGPTPIRLPPNANAKITMSKYPDRESRGEKSLRTGLEVNQKQQELDRQKRRAAQKAQLNHKRAQAQSVQSVQSVHNTFNPHARSDSRSLSPPTSPKTTTEKRPQTPSRTPSPFKSPSAAGAAPNTIPPYDVAPTAKMGSPMPKITLNNDSEQPKIPVFHLPAARRKPVSIFAPKVKRRVGA